MILRAWFAGKVADKSAPTGTKKAPAVATAEAFYSDPLKG